jgi:hypothetical protein
VASRELTFVHQYQSRGGEEMNIRMFILASILIVPVFLFNISCEKEQPVSEDVAQEQPVQESVGEEAQPSGVVHDEGADEDVETSWMKKRESQKNSGNGSDTSSKF